ncbi:hypothetical protein BJ165DRAFT_1474226 [Panaeolus papilionaceus]|nr:hypothetical protein BJ165DRAFT_1474226 [Panaeolus papilionaceus]
MISCTSLRFFATIIALSLINSTSAAVVTVYGVDAPRPARVTTRDLPQPSVEWAGTQTASAIGPGESGRTKYEVKYIQSRVVLHHAGGQQVTFVSEPMTATYTHEQGGNIVIQKGDPWVQTIGTGGTIDQIGLNVECTLDDKHQSGVCAGEQLHPVLTEILVRSE